jgi:hypothetical protein
VKYVKLFEDFLNEGSKVSKKDFDKVVDLVKASGQPATVMLVTKWNEIEIIVGMDAPDPIYSGISNELDKARIDRNIFSISGDSSSYSRREYDEIASVNGGHKDYGRYR